jgi:transcriptional regulator with XRE-family HTH domain
MSDIKALIAASSLSRQAICERVGITTAYLSMLERGKRRVGPDKAAALAEALGVHPVDLRPDLAAQAATFTRTGDAA